MSVTTRHWPGVMAQQTKTLRLLPLPSYAHSLPADLPAISIKTTRVTSACSLQKPHDDTTSIFSALQVSVHCQSSHSAALSVRFTTERHYTIEILYLKLELPISSQKSNLKSGCLAWRYWWDWHWVSLVMFPKHSCVLYKPPMSAVGTLLWEIWPPKPPLRTVFPPGKANAPSSPSPPALSEWISDHTALPCSPTSQQKSWKFPEREDV